MSKKKKTELLQWYLDGEGVPEDRMKAEQLINASRAAREELEHLRQADDQLNRLGTFHPSATYDQTFRRRLEQAPSPWPEETARGGRLFGLFLPLTLPRAAMAAAVVVLLAGASILLPYLTRGTFPRVGMVSGTAEIYRAREASWVKAVPGMDVRGGDILRTAGASRMELASENRYSFRLSGDSEMVVRRVVPSRRKGRTVLTLHTGTLLARTDEGFEGSSLFLDTPLGQAVVRGTAFLIEVGPEGVTSLSVVEGEVELTSFYREEEGPAGVMVTAGRASIIRPDAFPVPPQRLTAGRIKALSNEIDDLGLPPADISTEDEADLKEPFLSLILSGEPDRVDELLKKPVLFVGPATPPKVRALLEEVGRLVKEGNYEGSVVLLRRILDDYPDPRYNATIELLIGAYYYGLLDDPDNALEIFQGVAESGDPRWSSLARIAIARIHELTAADWYRDVLKKHRHSVDARKARDRLKNISNTPSSQPDE